MARGAVNDEPEMRSVLNLKGGTWGLFAATGFAPGTASDLFHYINLL